MNTFKKLCVGVRACAPVQRSAFVSPFACTKLLITFFSYRQCCILTGLVHKSDTTVDYWRD